MVVPVKDPAHARAVTNLLLAALCWSLGGVLIKLVDWPPFAIAGARGFIAAIFLLIASRFAVKFTWSPIQIGAAVAYAGCTVLFAAANKHTTAANAILLQYTAPVYVAIGGAFLFGQRATRADWITIVIALAGIALFLYEGLRFEGMLGISLALGSGIAFAAMILLLSRQRDASPLGSIILGNIIGFLVGLPSILNAGSLPSPKGMLALLILGVVQLGFAYLLYSRALKHVTALESVLIPVIEPILNPVWVMLVIGEKPSPIAILGGIIVVSAVTWRATHSLRNPPPPVLPG
jgi:drug/metabolite transporter (DMT)-like permease